MLVSLLCTIVLCSPLPTSAWYSFYIAGVVLWAVAHCCSRYPNINNRSSIPLTLLSYQVKLQSLPTLIVACVVLSRTNCMSESVDCCFDLCSVLLHSFFCAICTSSVSNVTFLLSHFFSLSPTRDDRSTIFIILVVDSPTLVRSNRLIVVSIGLQCCISLCCNMELFLFLILFPLFILDPDRSLTSTLC